MSRITVFVCASLLIAGVGIAVFAAEGEDVEEIKVSGTVAFTSKNELDFRPYDPSVDPDVDMFIGDWQESTPYNTHGAVTERIILSRGDGDQLNPPRKGAALAYLNRVSRATLDRGAVTTPTTLDGEQELFYIVSGNGNIQAGGESYELKSGIFVFVPADLEFTMENTGNEILVMYLANEPVPDGFRPNPGLLVRDEKDMAYRDQGYLQAHWSHNGKNMFRTEDGLGTLEAVAVMTLHEMTIGQPHSIQPGMELVWLVVSGRNLEIIGKEIRWMEPGMAYVSPPTGYTPFGHQNPSETEPLKFLFFGRFKDHEVRK